MEGEIAGMGRFAYLNTESHAGTAIELVDVGHGKIRELSTAILAATQLWDGSDPVRDGI